MIASGGNKDAFYEQQNPPYKAKRNRFYTVDELKLVRDIDDHLFKKLKPYVTVYSYDGKININTAGKDLYRALYRDFTDDDLKRILDERDRQGGWPTVKTFTDFASGLRPGFGTLYSDPNNQPFTVGSQSFLIESLAIINRSGSSIQKVIRVAVALTAGKGGSVDPNFTDPNSCVKTPDHFWDRRTMQCRIQPHNANECQGIAGNVQVISGQTMCVTNNNAPIQMGGIGGPNPTPNPGTPGNPAASNPASEPNAMKILYWYES